jgi:23S rRNA pseudouridine2457 synthase
MMSEIVRSKSVEKEYYAQVDGIINEEAIAQIKGGVEIGFKGIRYTTKKCEAKIINQLPDCISEGRRIRDDRHGPTSWISITLTEGKFRQVRKMTAAVGFPTLRLVRIRVGVIHLQNLKAGEVIEVESFFKS